MTHEEFIHGVRDLAVARLPEGPDRTRLENAKLVYGLGLGSPGVRGMTVFGTWKNGEPEHHDSIEICACGEEGPTQLAGTTIHELAHCLAGSKAGHGKAWKDACEVLGLRCAKAAGHRYHMANFAPALRAGIARMGTKDGAPVFGLAGLFGALVPFRPRPCSMGIGTRGGKSRGKGSGSRLRKWVCGCGVIARVASDDFQATCQRCNSAFARGDAEAAAA